VEHQHLGWWTMGSRQQQWAHEPYVCGLLHRVGSEMGAHVPYTLSFSPGLLHLTHMLPPPPPPTHPPPPPPLPTQVVVHNLPWTTTWQQLKDVFKEWKVERADVVYDSYNKSRWGRVAGGTRVCAGEGPGAAAAVLAVGNDSSSGGACGQRGARSHATAAAAGGPPRGRGEGTEGYGKEGNR
jgi:hypothetical protein